MKIGIVCSEDDIASKNICEFLNGAEVIKTQNSLNFSADKTFNLLIFPSKHESKKNINSLTCHTPGNFATAQFGGKDRTLSISDALIQTECLKHLFKINQGDMEVCLEATHHGPSLEIPCLFVEIGSSEEQWNNKRYCSGIASVIKHIVKNYKIIKKQDKEIAVAFGGSHYQTHLSNWLVKNNIAVGHICPSYQLENLDETMFRQMIEKTVPAVKLAIVDKSTPKIHKRKIKEWSKTFNLRYEEI